jgi:hypothetical protein
MRSAKRADAGSIMVVQAVLGDGFRLVRRPKHGLLQHLLLLILDCRPDR